MRITHRNAFSHNTEQRVFVLGHLGTEANDRYAETEVTWTINIDGIPVFAVAPEPSFADEVYGKLTTLLADKEHLVSVGGLITGETRLYNGMVVPIVAPTAQSIEEMSYKTFLTSQTNDRTEAFEKFLNQIHRRYRNRGISESNRALNFALAHGLPLVDIFNQATDESYVFQKIHVEESKIQIPHGWLEDVAMSFQPLASSSTLPAKTYHCVIDVAHVIPVRVTELDGWANR